MPDSVRIVEVGPRDGLQNEKVAVSVATKLELITRLSEAGLSTIEVGSFVSPKRVPQMADTDQVMRGLAHGSGIRYPVLVPNEEGMVTALVLQGVVGYFRHAGLDLAQLSWLSLTLRLRWLCWGVFAAQPETGSRHSS